LRWSGYFFATPYVRGLHHCPQPGQSPKRAPEEGRADLTEALREPTRAVDYAAYIAKGLPIGIGVVEAACKTLAAQRMKRSGMSWAITATASYGTAPEPVGEPAHSGSESRAKSGAPHEDARCSGNSVASFGSIGSPSPWLWGHFRLGCHPEQPRRENAGAPERRPRGFRRVSLLLAHAVWHMQRLFMQLFESQRPRHSESPFATLERRNTKLWLRETVKEQGHGRSGNRRSFRGCPIGNSR